MIKPKLIFLFALTVNFSFSSLFGSVTKGITYLGLASGCGYISYKSYDRARGRTDSKLTAELIYQINKQVRKLIVEDKKNKKQGILKAIKKNINQIKKHNNIQIFLKDTKRDIAIVIAPEEASMRYTSAGLAAISGLAGITFVALGLKNLQKK